MTFNRKHAIGFKKQHVSVSDQVYTIWMEKKWKSHEEYASTLPIIRVGQFRYKREIILSFRRGFQSFSI